MSLDLVSQIIYKRGMCAHELDICLLGPLPHELAYGQPNIVAGLLSVSPTFRNKAVPAVRNSYVEDTMRVAERAHTRGEPLPKREKIREMLAMLSWMNPICVRCRRKGPGTRYHYSEDCYLYMYCSEECMRADRDHHLTYCCKADAPSDPTDPMGPAFVTTS